MAHFVIHNATIQDIERALQPLAALASQEKARNPLRPQPHELIPRRADVNQLPVYARPKGGVVLVVYATLPDSNAPFGVPLLLIVARRRKDKSISLCIRREPAFPLTQREIHWFLQRTFPTLTCVDERERRIFAVAESKSKQRDSDGEIRHARRRTAGAPLLACNQWLMDALRTLEDRTAFHHLYSEWLGRYERVRGHAPSDPKRSFRAAVKTCLARISRDEHRGDGSS